MDRTLYSSEHKDFGESFRAFLTKNAAPGYEQWERDGIVPREFFTEAGRGGFLALEVDERYGGAAVEDFRFNAMLHEVGFGMDLTGAVGGITLHNDICLPYFTAYCDEQQRERWLPGIANGDYLTSVAMTEPGAGSDLAGISTRAVKAEGGWVVNGAKTFITNGINSDLVIAVVRTDPDDRHGGLSLLVIERGMEGFERGRNLEKVGLHSADTAEMFFQDVFVPEENLLGELGMGFRYLTSNLPQERLSVAITAIVMARSALEHTLEYVKTRNAFGKSIGSFQNSRFVLAELATEIEIATVYLDRAILAHNERQLSAVDAAMAKWWCTDLQGRVVDRCLQLHGGYGYMLEYPIARSFIDSRVSRIYAGTNEIMKEIIGRSLGL
ncbi:MAG TPA: acyl-CoA dehydrogenase family protein [Solirubrobacteraceae bacterium]|jgi:alkylation response protein AidB-like acyl-CoA dehydrogenase|nr:acyl-CoA dehydrogenase family protein [Solirubrobacteraceae bacterium]